MNVSVKLSLEQEFELQVIEEQVKDLSLEQAQKYVVDITRQMMLKDNLYRYLFKDSLT